MQEHYDLFFPFRAYHLTAGLVFCITRKEHKTTTKKELRKTTVHKIAPYEEVTHTLATLTERGSVCDRTTATLFALKELHTK